MLELLSGTMEHGRTGFYTLRTSPSKDIREFTDNHQQRQLPPTQRRTRTLLRLWAIRWVAPDGTVSVLLTTRRDRRRLPRPAIIAFSWRHPLMSFTRDTPRYYQPPPRPRSSSCRHSCTRSSRVNAISIKCP